jgi:integrase
VRVRDRHGRQRSKSFERLSDALEWQGHRRASKDDSIPKSSSPITFDEYALSIPAMHPEWAEGTISGWHSRRKRLDRAGLGELRLSEITAGDIQRALAKLRSRGLSETTIDGTRGLVTAVYRHAMADELVDSSPTDRLPYTTRAPRSAVDDDAALTPAEVAELLEALPGRLRAHAVTMVSTGLRPAEAAGLTADRLDLLHGTLRIDRQLSDKLGPDKLPANPYPRSRSCSKNRHRNDDEGP